MSEICDEGLCDRMEFNALRNLYYKLTARGEVDAAGEVANALFELTMETGEPWRLSGIFLEMVRIEGQKNKEKSAAPDDRLEHKPVDGMSLAILYQKVGDDFLKLDAPAEAVPYLEKAVRFNPDFTLANYDLSLAYFMLGRYPEGARAARAALGDDPEMTCQRSNLGMGATGQLGLCLMNQGRLKEAAECFRKNIALMGGTYFNLGLTLLRMDRPKEALKYFSMAVEISPGDPEYLNVLGQAYGETGKVEKAEECLHKALEIDPKYALGYYDLGVILAKQRTRDREAKKCFEKAVALEPDMGWAHYSIACIDTLEGKKGEALKNLEAALEKGIDDKAHIDKDTDLDSIREDKRYQEMMRRYFG